MNKLFQFCSKMSEARLKFVWLFLGVNAIALGVRVIKAVMGHKECITKPAYVFFTEAKCWTEYSLLDAFLAAISAMILVAAIVCHIVKKRGEK